jgi:hypothetical protein
VDSREVRAGAEARGGPPMTRRGLTLVEVLGALSLLGLLMVACLSWTRMAVSHASNAGVRTRWERAAGAVLDLIGDGLRTGDACDPERKLRVDASAAVLVIRGRGSADGRLPGVVDRVYRRDPASGDLVVEEYAPVPFGVMPTQAPLGARPLLGEVRATTFALDVPSRVLSVEVAGPNAAVARREYIVP